MNVSIPPAAADEAGRLAELSAAFLVADDAWCDTPSGDDRLPSIHASRNAAAVRFALAASRLIRAGRLVPATPTADERADLSGVQVYVIGNDKFVTLDAHEAACAVYEAERASLVPATPTQSKDPRAAFNRLMDADATPTPPAPSRDLVEALTDARDTLQGLQAWLPDDFPTDALIAVHEAIAGADAALAATQAPAEPSQGVEAAMREALQSTTDALANMLGAYDTPIARRRYPPDEFMVACLESARGALPRGRAALSQSAGGR